MVRLGCEQGDDGGEDAYGAGGEEEGHVAFGADVVEDDAGDHDADCLPEGGERLCYPSNGSEGSSAVVVSVGHGWDGQHAP